MSSHLQEFMEDQVHQQLAKVVKLREEVCRQAWFLTHPLFRDRLVQIVQNLDALDWAVACRVDL